MDEMPSEDEKALWRAMITIFGHERMVALRRAELQAYFDSLAVPYAEAAEPVLPKAPAPFEPEQAVPWEPEEPPTLVWPPPLKVVSKREPTVSEFMQARREADDYEPPPDRGGLFERDRKY